MVEAALLRLVLLVPREAGLGFEIRTLQELMAARAVGEGPDEQVVDRLRLLADHPHWRNTWLLAAGRLLVASARFEELIAGMLQPGRREGVAGSPAVLRPGPRLSSSRRRSRGASSRLRTGTRSGDPFGRRLPPGGDLCGVATAPDGLLDGAYRALVLDRLAAAAGSGAARRATAAAVLDLMAALVGTPARRQSIQLARDRGVAVHRHQLGPGPCGADRH